MIKYFIESLGCAKNRIDAELMSSVLESRGFREAESPEHTDIAIINTCGFIDDAKKEAIDVILEYASLKKKRPAMRLIVTGCLAQRYPGDLYTEIPEIDVVSGVYSYNTIGSLLERLFHKEGRILDVQDKPRIIYDSAIKRNKRSFSAELKIADGCNNYCSYCVIPYVRGEFHSKRMESVIEEAGELASTGTKEIILVAQETTKYGIDLYSSYRLPELIQKISDIPGIEWIRVMYLNMWDINDELIDLFNRNRKLLRYVDIPIQNINDSILKAMNRRGGRGEISSKIDELRERIPDICIRSTLITGFPGEDEAVFRENLDFIRDKKIDRLGIFMYSDEEGTKAYELPGKIDEDIMQERYDILMSEQAEISGEINSSFVDMVLTTLVEGKDGDVYIGRTYRDAPDTDGYIFFESPEDLLPGDMVEVKVTGASEYDLSGVMI